VKHSAISAAYAASDRRPACQQIDLDKRAAR
jgi:hypothetical protein